MRKAQVTLYIIIGIVLLIGIILFVTLERETAETEGLQPNIDSVPPEHKKVQEYVLNCLEKVSTDAVKKVGEHGGYLDPKNYTYSPNDLDIGSIPTESDAVYLSGSSQPVPYWWHLASSNDCMDCDMSTENIPTMDEILEQISLYVDNNLYQCINEFEPIEEQGYEVKEEMHETSSYVTEDSVIVQTTYPIQFEKDDLTISLENFGVELDAPLLKFFSQAFYLTAKQAQEQYLETGVMTLISYQSGLSSDRLPPLTNVDTSYSTTVWVKPNVKHQIESLLNSYIPFFRVNNTIGGDVIESGNVYEEAFFNITHLHSNISMNESTIDFLFLDWPIYFDISPRDGQLLRPSTYRNEFPFNMVPAVQTNHYEFFYDISFPVVVYMRDDEALKDEGFDFVFAFEGNVRDNKDMLSWFHGEGTIGPWDYSGVSIEKSNMAEQDDEETPSMPEDKLICNEKQRVVGPVTIEVSDDKTRQPVEHAAVTYKCGHYDSCSLGYTDESGVWEGKVPICKGAGIVVEEGTEFAPAIIEDIPYELDEEFEFELELDRLSTKKVRVKKVHESNFEGIEELTMSERENIRGSAVELQSHEKVILSLEKKQEHAYDGEFKESIIIEGNTTEETRLLPGEYEVRGTFLNEEGVVTENRNESIEGRTVEYPSVELKPATLGGLRLNNETGEWHISHSDVKKDEIIFYVVTVNEPQVITEMDNIEAIEEISNDSRRLLEPEFR
ncbi:MAG: hypothetical protein ACOCZ6_01520 [Nanoarchaeota archaeon]